MERPRRRPRPRPGVADRPARSRRGILRERWLKRRARRADPRRATTPSTPRDALHGDLGASTLARRRARRRRRRGPVAEAPLRYSADCAERHARRPSRRRVALSARLRRPTSPPTRTRAAAARARRLRDVAPPRGSSHRLVRRREYTAPPRSPTTRRSPLTAWPADTADRGAHRIPAFTRRPHSRPPSWEQRAWAAVLRYWPAALDRRLRSTRPPAAPSRRRERPTMTRSRWRCRILGRVDLDAGHHGLPPVLVRHGDPAALGPAPGAPRARSAPGGLPGAEARTPPSPCSRTPASCGAQLPAASPRPFARSPGCLGAIYSPRSSRTSRAGAYSALERRYLTRVERPHGLPVARRQRRVRPGRSIGYRDVDYLGLRTVVELDGRLGHERANDRWADLDRDVDSAVAGDLTLRAGWKQVLDPCRLAAAVTRVLVARGWTGRPTGCRPGCPVGHLTENGGSPAPGAGDLR